MNKIMNENIKKITFIVMLLILLLFSMVAASTIGPEKIPFFDSMRILLKKIPLIGSFINLSDVSEAHMRIIYIIRIPRILAATLVGMALAGSGVVFQGVLKNPLAEPYILGISSGAAFGATLTMVFGISFTFIGLSSISIGAFLGAIITMIVVYNIGIVGSKSSSNTLLLSGIAISFLLSSMVSLMIALNRDQIEKIIFWTMGSLSSVRMEQIQVIYIPIIISIGVFLFFARDLNVMLLGDDSAKSMGIDVSLVRKILLLAATLATAFSVSISGIIGFVGLIVPHAMRLIIGPNHKYLIPSSIFAGAIFLILSDTIARTIIAPGQMPLGVITAVIGSPYFIFLLQRSNKRKYRG